MQAREKYVEYLWGFSSLMVFQYCCSFFQHFWMIFLILTQSVNYYWHQEPQDHFCRVRLQWDCTLALLPTPCTPFQDTTAKYVVMHDICNFVERSYQLVTHHREDDMDQRFNAINILSRKRVTEVLIWKQFDLEGALLSIGTSRSLKSNNLMMAPSPLHPLSDLPFGICQHPHCCWWSSTVKCLWFSGAEGIYVRDDDVPMLWLQISKPGFAHHFWNQPRK